MQAADPCTASIDDFRGWKAVYLANGLVTVAAVPDIGGRIMAYNLGDYEYLFVDPTLAGKLFTAEQNLGDGTMVCWKNYGGDKTWPAPQGWDGPDQWPGPPDPILDTGRYELTGIEAVGNQAGLSMISPRGSSTGVRITRAVKMRAGSSRLQLQLTFTNTAKRTVRWSIWDVVQLGAGRAGAGGRYGYDNSCVVTAPLNPRSSFPGGYTLLFGKPDNPQWQADWQRGLFLASYQFQIGKVGLDSRGGWIAFANTAAGYAFVQRFEVEPGGLYPDHGSDVECWTVGSGQAAGLSYDELSGPFLMETEVLSSFRDIAPGGTSSFNIEWGACRCSGPILAASEGGCFSEPLRIVAGEGRAALSGVCGVFDAGTLVLTWLAAGGVELESASLGEVSPLELVYLHQSLDLPRRAVEARLSVVTSGGGASPLAAVPVS
jgi:hypothetical protein